MGKKVALADLKPSTLLKDVYDIGEVSLQKVQTATGWDRNNVTIQQYVDNLEVVPELQKALKSSVRVTISNMPGYEYTKQLFQLNETSSAPASPASTSSASSVASPRSPALPRSPAPRSPASSSRHNSGELPPLEKLIKKDALDIDARALRVCMLQGFEKDKHDEPFKLLTTAVFGRSIDTIFELAALSDEDVKLLHKATKTVKKGTVTEDVDALCREVIAAHPQDISLEDLITKIKPALERSFSSRFNITSLHAKAMQVTQHYINKNSNYPHKRAVCIGITKYSATFSPQDQRDNRAKERIQRAHINLPATSVSSKMFEKALSDRNFAVQSMSDPRKEVTRDDIMKQLQWLTDEGRKKKDRKSMAVFTYCGHSIEIGGQYFIIPSVYTYHHPDLKSLEGAQLETAVKRQLNQLVSLDEIRLAVKEYDCALFILNGCRTRNFPEFPVVKKGTDQNTNPISSVLCSLIENNRQRDIDLDPKEGSLLLFATGYGAPVVDGLEPKDQNESATPDVFTTALIEQIQREAAIPLSRLHSMHKEIMNKFGAMQRENNIELQDSDINRPNANSTLSNPNATIDDFTIRLSLAQIDEVSLGLSNLEL